MQKARGPWPIILCSHYDPGMTLTYFTAKSNFATKTEKGNNDGNIFQHVAWKLFDIVNLMSK